MAEAAAALAEFTGAGRRFELRGERDGIWIVDDYAHHPTEVAATIEAARTWAPGRVVVCFQPHLYSRTEALAFHFGRALATADEVVVTEIYPAREDPLEGVTAQAGGGRGQRGAAGHAAGLRAHPGRRRALPARPHARAATWC